MTTPKKWTKLVVIPCLGVALAMGAACGGGSERTGSSQQATGRGLSPAGQKPAEVTGDFFWTGINWIATNSQAAVVATVTSVSEPRSYTYTEDNGRVYERTIRDVHVRIDRVIYGSADLKPDVGQDLRVVSYGSGKGGEPVKLPSGNTIYAEESDGHFASGEQKLLVLTTVPGYPTPEGRQTVIQLVQAFQGQWTIVGPLAVSDDPQRSVPVDALEKRLLEERKGGRNRAHDERTVTNPLAP
jgi:hypothetical protein